ncbi:MULTISPECIES: hypothetical protein [Acidianus]|uniref:Uncharacterized protein n=1 Tax=Candidatus Acidianus copahuensis TaxID=1160895 RepID=A0A031LME9_9CREN|nr:MULTISPECIES: hypothetical protein [Acidianus]EZQ02078.1 hypothetical protein CM19_11470 [Candidatus Acidianus copahuensis]NON63462.1 hypothetical protein [Acidianus sp. RZ1]
MLKDKFFKPVRLYRDPHVAVEIVAELAASRLGSLAGFPVIEVELADLDGRKGIIMEYLPEKATKHSINISEIMEALAFEEVILNVDLKEEHVLAKNGKAYIIDHGHSFNAWKPLYFIQEIVSKRVTRFNLWSDKESFLRGVEKINSIDEKEVRKVVGEAVNDVVSFEVCKLFDDKLAKETIEISSRIFSFRKSILLSLF